MMTGAANRTTYKNWHAASEKHKVAAFKQTALHELETSSTIICHINRLLVFPTEIKI